MIKNIRNLVHLTKFLQENYPEFIEQINNEYKISFLCELATLIFAEQVFDTTPIKDNNKVYVFKDLLKLRNQIELSILDEPDKAFQAQMFLEQYEKAMELRIMQRGPIASATSGALSAAAGIVTAAVVQGATKNPTTAAIAGAAAASAAKDSETVKEVANAVENVVESMANSASAAVSPPASGGTYDPHNQYNPPFPEPSPGGPYHPHATRPTTPLRTIGVYGILQKNILKK